MTRRIRALNGGRARVWWVHHGREAIRAMQLTALVALFLAASTADYRDQLAMERAAREDAERLVQDRTVLANQLPAVTFVLQARTPEELRERLADVAGAADGERIRSLIPTK